jgi:xylulokinase
VPPGQVAGRVRAFTATGLRHGTPVVVAGHDHAVGAFAAGVREPGDVADSLGTAEALLTVVAAAPDPVAVAAAGMSPVVTVGGRRGILAGSSAAGALVGWWLEREGGGRDAGDLFAQALALGGRPGDILVLPYLSGRQTPAPDPTAGVRIVGRRPEHTPPELAKAMLEGLCLQARWMLAEQARLAGREPAGVTVLGSAVTANPAWLRIKARVMPVPLRAVTAGEPVAAGAALVAAARAGVVAEPPVLERQHVASDVPPTRYDGAFAAFVTAATGTGGGARGAPPGEGGDRG